MAYSYESMLECRMEKEECKTCKERIHAYKLFFKFYTNKNVPINNNEDITEFSSIARYYEPVNYVKCNEITFRFEETCSNCLGIIDDESDNSNDDNEIQLRPIMYSNNVDQRIWIWDDERY